MVSWHRRAVRLAALLALMAGGAGAAPVDLPDEVLGTHWYTISILGKRSGWSEQALRRTPTGYESRERTVLQVALDGYSLTSSRSETRRYDEALQLLAVENEADQVGRRVRVTAYREGDKLRVTRTSPDGETHQELPVSEHFGQDLYILQAVLQKQITAGWKTVFSTFDCDLGQIDEITVSAVERVSEPQPAWVLQAQSKLLNVLSRTWASDAGVILRQDVPGMMQMTMQLVTEAEALAAVEPFLLASSVPVQQEMGRPEKLQRVRLEVRDGGGEPDTLFPTTSRQTVTGGGDKAVLIVLAQNTPTTSGQLPFTAPDLQPYLQPSDVAQSADPQLVAQMQEIIGGERDAWRAAQLLMRWVNRQMVKVASEPRPLSALEVLQIKRGDCTEHAVLLAGLAQAAGIPARMVAGLAYDAKAYHYHAWNELYVGEWVEMDPTWGQETVDAGHIQVAASALDSTSIARMSLAASRTMGTLKLNVLDYDARR
jgi:hypothetical protein